MGVCLFHEIGFSSRYSVQRILFLLDRFFVRYFYSRILAKKFSLKALLIGIKKPLKKLCLTAYIVGMLMVDKMNYLQNITKNKNNNHSLNCYLKITKVILY